MNIITNNQPRMLSDDTESVKYRGHEYDLGDFLRVEPNSELVGWAGYTSDTFFSGVVIKFCPDDNDFVIMGRYCV